MDENVNFCMACPSLALFVGWTLGHRAKWPPTTAAEARGNGGDDNEARRGIRMCADTRGKKGANKTVTDRADPGWRTDKQEYFWGETT